MDKHLCGCRYCPLYEELAAASQQRRQWEALFTDGCHLQEKWLDAQEWEQQARSDWLDHVLAHQNRSLVTQAA